MKRNPSPPLTPASLTVAGRDMRETWEPPQLRRLGPFNPQAPNGRQGQDGAGES